MLLRLVCFMLLTVSLFSHAETAESLEANAEGQIIAYFDKDWKTTATKQVDGFYRKLLKVESQGYWVQDFYASTDTKQTDVFLITNKQELTAHIISQRNTTLMLWYPEGPKKEQYTYKDGVLQSAVGWHRNGQKRFEGNFKDNHKQGLWKAWYANGQQVWQGHFIENKREGQWVFWYTSGKLKAQGNYKNDKKQDIWSYYDREGRKIQQQQYKEDEKIAQWDFTES